LDVSKQEASKTKKNYSRDDDKNTQLNVKQQLTVGTGLRPTCVHTMQQSPEHRTALIVCPLIVQTIITAGCDVVWEETRAASMTEL